MTVKAIETVFRGYRFRSRLEARWAVFFDALGIAWEYEKEGFESNGTRYLPDFWLPDVWLRGYGPGLWLEIKADEKSMAEDEGKMRIVDGNLVVFLGLPPTEWQDAAYQISPDWDNCMLIVKCYNPKCGRVKVEFSEGNYMFCPGCQGPADWKHPGIAAAAMAARAARFEHGESGR